MAFTELPTTFTDRTRSAWYEWETGDTDAGSKIYVPAGALVDVHVDVGTGETVDLEVETTTGASQAVNDLVAEQYTADTVKVLQFASPVRIGLTKSVDNGQTTRATLKVGAIANR